MRENSLKDIICPEQDIFTYDYLRIWVHMKAVTNVTILFQIWHGSLLLSRKWLSTIQKCRGHLRPAPLRKPKNYPKFSLVKNV